VRDGALCGGIGFDPYTDLARRGAEVGYWLGVAHWGRGIATEALRAFTRHVFETTDLVRLQATVLGWNRASMRVLEKAGYTRDGHLPQSLFKDGEQVDSVLYGRVRDGL
jgi:RimJ/RimL family protein N-acetyltransferase